MLISILAEQIKTLKCFQVSRGKKFSLVSFTIRLTSLLLVSFSPLYTCCCIFCRVQGLENELPNTSFSKHGCSCTMFLSCSVQCWVNWQPHRREGPLQQRELRHSGAFCCHLHCLALLCNLRCKNAFLLWLSWNAFQIPCRPTKQGRGTRKERTSIKSWERRIK